MRYLLRLLLLMGAGVVQAGTQCRERIAEPGEWAAATGTALRVVAELEEHDAPIALVARVGTDLSQQGIRYSHTGFVVRDHPDGRWTVVHLLNHCGTDSSALFAEGLINFFGDDLINYDSRIVWLKPAHAEALLRLVMSDDIHRLYEPHYNIIAHPNSRHYQNSTSWVLELLAASAIGLDSVDRGMAQAQAQALGYRPFIVHIPYSKRIAGGLFSANAHFTDHSVKARLSGEYRVVTVESIFDWLRRIGWIEAERELNAGVL
jgi:hypothetical protein